MKFLRLCLLATAAVCWTQSVQADSIWMNPATNDGSFDVAWGVTLGGGLGDITNSENAAVRSSGVWSYDAFDGAGTPVPLDAGNLGFVEFKTSLSPNNGNAGQILASEGSQNPDNTFGSTKAVSAFVDLADRKVVYTTGLLSIPAGVGTGDVLNWSFEVQGLTGYLPVTEADVHFDIDFGGGNVESDSGVAIGDTDGLRNTFDVISGSRVLSAADLTAGTFTVGFSLENLVTSGSHKAGRVFLDNINISSETIPEPTSFVLMGMASLVLVLARRSN